MSWAELLSIYKEAETRLRRETAQRPTACPNDGEPLQSKDSTLWCPFDGYVWPETMRRVKR